MRWKICDKISPEYIAEYPDIDPVVLQLLWNREIKEDLDRFLRPDFRRDSFDPFLFRQMSEAVGMIISHIKEQNLITVYGDYDADGVTASALLVEVLETLRARAEVYIPHRFTEGYGLNREAIERIASGGASLVITVDGGIRSVSEAAYARELGLEIVVTDHHTTQVDENGADILPDCLVINPVVAAENYPDRKLAGVGVAFKLAQALISRSKLEETDKRKLEEKLLDLAAIGTVADCVSLKGENRIIVKEGLKALNRTKRAGLIALCAAAKIEPGTLNAWNIGFQIAPRLNAAGRLGAATVSFELLRSRDSQEARKLAEALNLQNQERQQITEDIAAQAEEQVKGELDQKILIAVCDIEGDREEDIWNEGVVGLVAGRLSNKFYRPVLVITKTKDGYKGSGRSIEEFNLIEAIAQAGECLERYGGHPAAAGFSLKADRIGAFKTRMQEVAAEILKDADLRPTARIDLELDLSAWSEELLYAINEMEPFGSDNPRPVFLSRHLEILDIINMGLSAQHLKLRLKSGSSPVLSAIAFGRSGKWDLKIGSRVDLVYTADLNEFNGRREIQLKIIDLKIM